MITLPQKKNNNLEEDEKEVKTYYCYNKCCKIYIQQYLNNDKFIVYNKIYTQIYNKINTKNVFFSHSLIKKYKKAGMFIYDPNKNNVLLVQSRGKFFGSPKGSLNINENEQDGAIREVLEETGIRILHNQLLKFINIFNRSIYYYIELDTCNINVQNTVKNNDANGISWINIDCLEKSILHGGITLNYHSKILFLKFLNKNFI